MPKILPKEVKLAELRAKMDSAAKCASICRHKKYQPSCCSCPDEKGCDIQSRYNNAHKKAKELRGDYND